MVTDYPGDSRLGGRRIFDVGALFPGDSTLHGTCVDLDRLRQSAKKPVFKPIWSAAGSLGCPELRTYVSVVGKPSQVGQIHGYNPECRGTGSLGLLCLFNAGGD